MMPRKDVYMHKSSHRRLSAGEWQGKLERYTKVLHNNIKSNPGNASDVDAQSAAEGAKLLKGINGRDFVVVLDERGQQCTSHDFANLLAHASASHNLCLFRPAFAAPLLHVHHCPPPTHSCNACENGHAQTP